MGLDVGSKTNTIFREVILNSKTILWNGPVGVFEMENFATGTISLGNAIAEATENGTFSLVGGGDSVAAVKQFNSNRKSKLCFNWWRRYVRNVRRENTSWDSSYIRVIFLEL